MCLLQPSIPLIDFAPILYFSQGYRGQGTIHARTRGLYSPPPSNSSFSHRVSLRQQDESSAAYHPAFPIRCSNRTTEREMCVNFTSGESGLQITVYVRLSKFPAGRGLMRSIHFSCLLWFHTHA